MLAMFSSPAIIALNCCLSAGGGRGAGRQESEQRHAARPSPDLEKFPHNPYKFKRSLFANITGNAPPPLTLFDRIPLLFDIPRPRSPGKVGRFPPQGGKGWGRLAGISHLPSTARRGMFCHYLINKYFCPVEKERILPPGRGLCYPTAARRSRFPPFQPMNQPIKTKRTTIWLYNVAS